MLAQIVLQLAFVVAIAIEVVVPFFCETPEIVGVFVGGKSKSIGVFKGGF